MKKQSKRPQALMAALILALACAGAAVAASGDAEDPLVTLSYLEQTAIPQVVDQVEERIAARQEELSQTLAGQIDQYRQEAEAALKEAGSAGEAGAAGYTLVTMSQGQTLALEVGCEVMLRVGTATVSADSSPALIDVSNAETAGDGAALVKNHLYMSTIAGRTINATANTVKLLVRGGHTLS